MILYIFGDEAGIENNKPVFSLGILVVEASKYKQFVAKVDALFPYVEEFTYKKLPSISSRMFEKYREFINCFPEIVPDFFMSLLFAKKAIINNFKSERDQLYYKFYYRLLEDALREKKEPTNVEIYLDERNVKKQGKSVIFKPVHMLCSYLRRHFEPLGIQITECREVNSRESRGIQYIDLILGLYTALYQYAEICPLRTKCRFGDVNINLRELEKYCPLYANLRAYERGEPYRMKNKVALLKLLIEVEISLNVRSNILDTTYNKTFSGRCFWRRATYKRKSGLNLWVWMPKE